MGCEDLSAYHNTIMLSEKPFGSEARDWDLPLEMSNSMWTSERTINFLKENAQKDKPLQQINSYIQQK
jgi:hypothetical protein